MTPKLSPRPFATSKPSSGCARSATTSPTSIPASIAAIRHAIKSWSAWSRSRLIFLRSKKTRILMASTTAARRDFSLARHRSGPATHRESDDARRLRRGRRSHSGYQSHRRRRSHGRLPCPTTQARGTARHPHRHGIPVGSDIEYTDEVTMLKAMEGRREM